MMVAMLSRKFPGNEQNRGECWRIHHRVLLSVKKTTRCDCEGIVVVSISFDLQILPEGQGLQGR